MPGTTSLPNPLVLLVDDQADTVSSAAAAHDGRPVDLLVSDQSLPDGTGHDVVRQRRTRTPALRGVAVSGHGSADDRAASAAAAGFARHLVKPIDFATFVQVCREVQGRP